MERPVLIETSARHAHVSQADLETLFGAGYALTPIKDLSQPGQFACAERVQVIGSKGSFPAVSILGPTRPETQVELSATDARSIGLSAPIRESGDLDGSAGCRLVGPAGEVTLEKGVVVAKRHVHMTPESAAEYGIADKQIVQVSVPSNGRALIFGDVVARVNPQYALAMHIDTDEANAACTAPGAIGEIIL